VKGSQGKERERAGKLHINFHEILKVYFPDRDDLAQTYRKGGNDDDGQVGSASKKSKTKKNLTEKRKGKEKGKGKGKGKEREEEKGKDTEREKGRLRRRDFEIREERVARPSRGLEEQQAGSSQLPIAGPSNTRHSPQMTQEPSNPRPRPRPRPLTKSDLDREGESDDSDARVAVKKRKMDGVDGLEKMAEKKRKLAPAADENMSSMKARTREGAREARATGRVLRSGRVAS
jgi:hypothetical protein